MIKKKEFWGIYERAYKKLGVWKFYFFLIGIGMFFGSLSRFLFFKNDFLSVSSFIIFFLLFYFIASIKLFKVILGEEEW
jgi:hypothetical protein